MTALLQVLNIGRYDKVELSNIILFSMGKLVSVFGSSIYTFAIGLYVLQLTGSGLNFAMTLVLGTIPMVMINPVAGVLADRVAKKKLVVAMDILNGILLLGVYFLSLIFGMHLAMIYISTFLMSIFTAIFGISLETAKPNIVKQNNLMNINSISKIIDSISAILGPMVGGVVFVLVDIRLFIFLNGVSFLFSGVSELFINFNYNNTLKMQENKSLSFLEDIKAGLEYIRDTEGLTKLMGTFVYLNFFIGLSITIPLPFIINNVLKLESNYYGIIQGGFPIGMIIGALGVKRIRGKMTYNKLLNRMCLLLSLAMILVGVPVLLGVVELQANLLFIYYTILTVVMGFAISLVDIPLFYELQTIIPDEYRGRVLSIGIAIGKAILPVALIISGMLINLLPAAVLPITGGILLFSISLKSFKF
ncbi:MFS transporter [Alkaliphilus peptidifermentans]|uniref:Transmembrane secretion effector n=1 Tax=Alkaliphilus peptidifermentans DSM 18978 TaxID=1120976 RepID=A0A1G5HCI9_9FIRM|nr:MFS transporter [Alkaliphilus peptidifermentans]SCY61427.1 Transmembrane secretion effector [Alkaliphilus peptidifermentans DSM 18978]